MHRIAIWIGITGALAISATGARTEDLKSPTLDKIRKSGVITLGYRETSIPFSYYDQSQQVVGYSRDIQLRIVEAVKKKLGLATLAINDLPVTSQNRIPLVQNGTVDLECGSTTNNLERQRQVAFSNSIFLVQTRLMTAKGSGVKEFEDLKDKTVVTMAGSTSERLLRSMNHQKQLGMNVISAKDQSESFHTLDTGRAVAFMIDDAILAGERAKARSPENWEIVGAPQSLEVYGCMMRKDDSGFKTVVDDVIAAIQSSGEIEAIYRKWFQSPIPPKGLNLDFPMSASLRALYARPNDRATDTLGVPAR